MTRKLSHFLMIGMVSVLIGYSSVATAQETTPEDLRDFLIEYAAAVAACGQVECSGLEDVEEQLLALDEEQLQALHDSIADIECFMEAGLSVIDACNVECPDNDEDGYSQGGPECGTWDCNDYDPNQYPGAPEVCNEQDDDCDEEVDEGDVCDPQSPRRMPRRNAVKASPAKSINPTAYPPDYPDTNGLAYLIFTAEIQAFNMLNEGMQNRANSEAVAGFHIAYEVLKQSTITAQSICDMTPFDAAQPIVCAPAGILGILTQYTEMILAEVEFHEDNIESAEIEASYENGVRILNNTVEVFNRVEQHDTDINARLDVIEGKIDQMMNRQLEVIRLLMTPQGQRHSDEPACDGGPCDWPYIPPKPKKNSRK